MISVKSYNKTILTVKGQETPVVKITNPVQKIRVVQSVSPIPLTSGEVPTIDGGNF